MKETLLVIYVVVWLLGSCVTWFLQYHAVKKENGYGWGHVLSIIWPFTLLFFIFAFWCEWPEMIKEVEEDE